MRHLSLAVLEARWDSRKERSVRPCYELLASVCCNNPNAYHYEMFNNAASLKECLPAIANSRGIRNIVIASHGHKDGIWGARDNVISRSILSHAIYQISRPIDGLFFSACEVGHEANAKFLFHDFGHKDGIGIEWIAGYSHRANWLKSAAFELLFWTAYFRELEKGGSSRVRMGRVCKSLQNSSAGLLAELGVGVYMRQLRSMPGRGTPKVVNLLGEGLTP